MAALKTTTLVIRISPEDRDLVAAAAAANDLETSTWARQVILQAARGWAARQNKREYRPQEEER